MGFSAPPACVSPFTLSGAPVAREAGVAAGAESKGNPRALRWGHGSTRAPARYTGISASGALLTTNDGAPVSLSRSEGPPCATRFTLGVLRRSASG